MAGASYANRAAEQLAPHYGRHVILLKGSLRRSSPCLHLGHAGAGTALRPAFRTEIGRHGDFAGASPFRHDPSWFSGSKLWLRLFTECINSVRASATFSRTFARLGSRTSISGPQTCNVTVARSLTA